ncbi:spike base protein, RCAP_Rcc01079 family [Devosia chinhatensis]|uniref:Uncharacterized protein n=1 Tax=Devosia chinhatensis TaxID=429727 RepID=A0A0F5FMK4_9HYPH|nr:hypothetical protein [Devosia chinhatensis]KKB09805.1 hypothetical protein VE26_08105 [Devosia chinhatensis]
MPDRFSSHSSGLDAPATHGFAIVPHDSNDLAEVTRAIFVSGGGNLVVQMASGATLNFGGIPAGTLLPIRANRVLAASTASGLVGLV